MTHARITPDVKQDIVDEIVQNANTVLANTSVHPETVFEILIVSDHDEESFFTIAFKQVFANEKRIRVLQVKHKMYSSPAFLRGTTRLSCLILTVEDLDTMGSDEIMSTLNNSLLTAANALGLWPGRLVERLW